MIYGLNFSVRVIKMGYRWAFDKNRVYEFVNGFGGAIQSDCGPQCIMEACRAGRLNFLRTFLRILLALFGIQTKRSRKTNEFIM